MVGIELIVIIHHPGLNSLNERTVHVPANILENLITVGMQSRQWDSTVLM